MVQLRILSGSQAGACWAARRFPVRIGRAATSDLQLQEDGVWEEHGRLEYSSADGFVLKAQGEALVRVNEQPVQEAALRNGDTIELGSSRLQFWLKEPRQGSVRLREALTWLGIAGVFLGQLALIYWLLQ